MIASCDAFVAELQAGMAAARRRDLHRDIQRTKKLLPIVAKQAPDMLGEWVALIRELEARHVDI
jgi:hypothetical protein